MSGMLAGMADLALDTPIGIYGLTSIMLPDPQVTAAYARLSPSTLMPYPMVDAWWEQISPVRFELPELTPLPASQRDDGSWSMPDSSRLMSVGLPAAGVASAQLGVNGEHVQALAAQDPAERAQWPPVHLGLLGAVVLVLDGTHRVCATGLTGDRRILARVADLGQTTTCPCGWQGQPGGVLTHTCPHPAATAH